MISGHVKSMMNLSLVRCKILKIPSPVINDKLIPISSSFFCRRAESVEEARITVYGWRQALNQGERSRARKERTVGILLAKCKSSAAQNISREYRKI